MRKVNNNRRKYIFKSEFQKKIGSTMKQMWYTFIVETVWKNFQIFQTNAIILAINKNKYINIIITTELCPYFLASLREKKSLE